MARCLFSTQPVGGDFTQNRKNKGVGMETSKPLETIKIKKFNGYNSDYELSLLANRFKILKFYNLHNEHLYEISTFFQLNDIAQQAKEFIAHHEKYGYTAKSHIKRRAELWDIVISHGIKVMTEYFYDKYFVQWKMNYDNIPNISGIPAIQFVD